MQISSPITAGTRRLWTEFKNVPRQLKEKFKKELNQKQSNPKLTEIIHDFYETAHNIYEINHNIYVEDYSIRRFLIGLITAIRHKYEH